MGMTLTLDDDIAIEIARLRDAQKLGLKEIGNRVMRVGLQHMAKAPPTKRKKVKIPVFSVKHKFLCEGIVKTHDLLAFGEGEDHK